MYATPPRLYALQQEDGRWNLYIGWDCHARSGQEREVLVLEDFAASAPQETFMENSEGESRARNSWENYEGEVPRLAAAENSEWQCTMESGIKCQNKVMNKEYHLAMRQEKYYWAPWHICNAAQLGSDLVVFQLGKDQICLLHIPTKRLALIARGYGPLVVESKVGETSALPSSHSTEATESKNHDE